MAKGDNKHLKYLNKLDQNMRKGIFLGGLLVVDKAQELAPIREGTMMRSVTSTPTRRMAGKLRTMIGPGPEAPYAKYTELNRYIKDKELGPKSVAKGTAQIPWLRPALKAEKNGALAILRAAIKNTRVS